MRANSGIAVENRERDGGLGNCGRGSIIPSPGRVRSRNDITIAKDYVRSRLSWLA
jgi:hypothetical protein